LAGNCLEDSFGGTLFWRQFFRRELVLGDNFLAEILFFQYFFQYFLVGIFFLVIFFGGN
jgi:hypothetical protein